MSLDLPNSAIDTVTVQRQRREIPPKRGAGIALKQITWSGGLRCVWHHLPASFGQDVAANESGFVSHSPKASLRCCLEIFHPTGQDLPDSQEAASIFSWAKKNASFSVFSLHKHLHICGHQKGV